MRMKISKQVLLNQQMSESFLTAALLSFSGGLQDAYTYLARGKVFANAQTGNIVLLSKNLFEGKPEAILRYFVPLAFFAMGVAAAECFRYRFKNAQKLHWRQGVLVIEILLLFLVGYFPASLNLLANALVSFSCAMQVQAFRKVNSYQYASTMCIGNLRSGVEAFVHYKSTRQKRLLHRSLHYFSVIFAFAMGAGTGSLLVPLWGMQTLWVSCVLLFIILLLMFIPAPEQIK